MYHLIPLKDHFSQHGQVSRMALRLRNTARLILLLLFRWRVFKNLSQFYEVMELGTRNNAAHEELRGSVSSLVRDFFFIKDHARILAHLTAVCFMLHEDEKAGKLLQRLTVLCNTGATPCLWVASQLRHWGLRNEARNALKMGLTMLPENQDILHALNSGQTGK